MYRSHTKDLKIWGCKGVYPRLVRMDQFFTQSGCGFMRRYLHDNIFYFFIFLFFWVTRYHYRVAQFSKVIFRVASLKSLRTPDTG